jgi:hypothetical protein
MDDKLEWIWKEVVMTCSRHCPVICLEGLRNHENLRRAGVQAESRIEHLQNTGLEGYFQVSLSIGFR